LFFIDTEGGVPFRMKKIVLHVEVILSSFGGTKLSRSILTASRMVKFSPRAQTPGKRGGADTNSVSCSVSVIDPIIKPRIALYTFIIP
jgi:hypothetical protein